MEDYLKIEKIGEGKVTINVNQHFSVFTQQANG